ncbi:MAG: hypothetical protein D3M94_17320 [Rhodocyclales bacterium GT-UBC]|nr:MAG: hypothetical protein D3M94_17320 [Rhodocyclales bacterium GT-UBC]
MNDKKENTCDQCRYFRAADALTGNCHRFPPSFAGDSSPRETHHWRFPMVSSHAWCGEFLPVWQDQISSIGATI